MCRVSARGIGLAVERFVPIRRISRAIRCRPTLNPCSRSRSRSMHAPANGSSKCNSSIRRISASLLATPGSRTAKPPAAHSCDRSSFGACSVDGRAMRPTSATAQKLVPDLIGDRSPAPLSDLGLLSLTLVLLFRSAPRPSQTSPWHDQVRLPLRNLIGVDIKLLRELNQRLVTT